MKAAAIYARVSTQDQAAHGTSLDGQLESCRQYAEANGYTVLNAIKEDVSGALLSRPGLDGIRDMAQRSELAAVVVYDPDRLTRNLGHLMLLMEEFERARVELLFVNAPHEDTPEGRMMLQMRGMFAEYERTKIQERTRRGKERRVREGRILGTWMAPYGYISVAGEGRFEVVEIEAIWIARIFDWLVNERCSLRQIVKRLNDMGAPTKRGAAYWSPSTVRSILSNSLYTGEWFWNKTVAVAPTRPLRELREERPKRQKSSTALRDRSEWIPVQVPALIPGELYASAQRQLQQNKELSPRNCKAEFLLRGLLRCAHCGRRFAGRKCHNRMDSQYYCSGHHTDALKEKCRAPYLNGARIERDLWDAVVERLTNEELIRKALDERERGSLHERTQGDAELASLYSAEQRLKTETNKLIDLHLEDRIDLPTFDERMALVRKKQDALNSARSEIQERMRRREIATANQAAIALFCAKAQ